MKYRLRKETYEYRNPKYFLERLSLHKNMECWVPENVFDNHNEAVAAYRERIDYVKTSEVILES